MDVDILIKLLLSALLGGVVGLEREYQNKYAGLRTLIVICVGSCLFTILSKIIGGIQSPDRIASNIITGIGFLGAGIFFRTESRVSGITTAASIWVVASIGMAVGEGEYVSATFTTFLVVGVLILLTYIERILDDVNNLKIYKIECATKENALRDFEILLQQHKLRARNIKKIKTKESMTGQWEAYGKSKNHAKFIAEVWKDQRVMCFEFE